MEKIKLQIKDIAVALLTVLGIVSSLKKVDVPFWVFIMVFLTYAIFRYFGKTNEPVKK